MNASRSLEQIRPQAEPLDAAWSAKILGRITQRPARRCSHRRLRIVALTTAAVIGTGGAAYATGVVPPFISEQFGFISTSTVHGEHRVASFTLRSGKTVRTFSRSGVPSTTAVSPARLLSRLRADSDRTSVVTATQTPPRPGSATPPKRARSRSRRPTPRSTCTGSQPAQRSDRCACMGPASATPPTSIPAPAGTPWPFPKRRLRLITSAPAKSWLWSTSSTPMVNGSPLTRCATSEATVTSLRLTAARQTRTGDSCGLPRGLPSALESVPPSTASDSDGHEAAVDTSHGHLGGSSSLKHRLNISTVETDRCAGETHVEQDPGERRRHDVAI